MTGLITQTPIHYYHAEDDNFVMYYIYKTDAIMAYPRFIK